METRYPAVIFDPQELEARRKREIERHRRTLQALAEDLKDEDTATLLWANCEPELLRLMKLIMTTGKP